MQERIDETVRRRKPDWRNPEDHDPRKPKDNKDERSWYERRIRRPLIPQPVH